MPVQGHGAGELALDPGALVAAGFEQLQSGLGVEFVPALAGTGSLFVRGRMVALGIEERLLHQELEAGFLVSAFMQIRQGPGQKIVRNGRAFIAVFVPEQVDVVQNGTFAFSLFRSRSGGGSGYGCRTGHAEAGAGQQGGYHVAFLHSNAVS